MPYRVERVIGGPGTGKTHLVLGRLTDEMRRMNLSPEEVGLCTFTRAGRQELSTRAAAAWGCSVESLTRDGWFRTAHSIAHRQCEVREGSLLQGEDGAKWISDTLGGQVVERYDAGVGSRRFTSPDPMVAMSLQAWDLARNKMAPLAVVLEQASRVQDFVPTLKSAAAIIDKYETRKIRDGRLDFVDMVARFAGVRFTTTGGAERCEPQGGVPGSLRALAIDEAQDSSALVDLVCRRLASSDAMEYVLLTGDPYQSVFAFGGSSFRHFLSWDAKEEIMPQSYRCSRQIMDYGEQCIRRMRSGYRDRGIMPADHDGRVCQVCSAEEAIASIKADQTCLILGRCSFSLAAYESALNEANRPYVWIDKSQGGRHLSGFACLWALQNGRVVTGDQWAAAVEIMPVSNRVLGPLLARGEKTAWAEGRRGNIDLIRPTPEFLKIAGATETWAKIILQGEWQDYVHTRRKAEAQTWVRSAKRWGEEAASNPKIRLSTIHSAKGLEDENVILSTIASPAVTRARQRLTESHDEECRVAYVAVTRAKRRLTIVHDSYGDALELPL